MTLFEDVVGQERAVAQLRAAVAAPVHAYLLAGPPGSGKRAAARSFAAALVCPNGGCGECRDCTIALADSHPDVRVVERVGASITVDQADEIVRQASRSPVEGDRQVLVLVDFHLVRDAAAKLLKTIEEPPASTVFVVLADDVPAELVTIASRCVRIDFTPVPEAVVVDTLVAEGTERPLAEEIARASAGRLDRARLLASDPGFRARRDAWASAPARLDGTGAQVASVVDELVGLLAAAEATLTTRHEGEITALQERIERYGERGSGRKQLEERHNRERRRLRADELRFGLATMAAAYRDAAATSRSPAACLEAVRAIEDLNREIVRNPSETLQLQALLLRLSAAGVALPQPA